MEKLLLSLVLIAGGLGLGYILQKADSRGKITLPMDVADLRKLLQKIGLLFFMPISFLGAVWIVSFGDIRVALLPVVGVSALLAGGGFGLLLAAMFRVERAQIGVMYCCGSFTNIGAIGGLVCYLFLGEAGFALVALYKMFEEISYYTIGFPLARYFGGSATHQAGLLKRVTGVFLDPFVATILCAFFVGLFLNLAGFERPLVFKIATALSVPLGTFVLLVSIGLGMHFSSIRIHLGKCLAISVVKFVFVPAIACSLAYFFGLHKIADGLPFNVVVILSSMPVAFNALVAASIFDLDLDLANSCWLVTTGALVAVLPWLYFLVH